MSQDLLDQAQARVGAVLLSKYRLARLLGVGGMAAVYEAEHTRNRDRVAIKMLHPSVAILGDIRKRFLREGYVANSVGHRGAVRVSDDGQAEDGSVFLIMELLEGETLDSRHQRAGGRMPPQQVCEIAWQLLDVLASAHQNGIVHRDVKPENVFLTRDGVLKVLDFGIARLADGAVGSGSVALTRSGRMVGTPAFMPPEQALGKLSQIDGQTDLWAVGATMFTLLTGAFVHEAETVEEMLVLTASRPARRVSSVTPQLPAGVADVVDRALAFDKKDRWASAGAMQLALEAAYVADFRAQIPGARRARGRLDAPPLAKTQPEKDGPATTVDDPALVPPGGARTEPMTEVPPPVLGRPISTTAGLSEDIRPAGVPGRRRSGVWLGVGGGSVAMIAVAVFLLVKSGPGGDTAGAAANGSPPAVASSLPVPSATAMTSSVTASASTPATSSTAGPSAATQSARTLQAPPATHAAAARGCDQPYYWDDKGKHIKPECL